MLIVSQQRDDLNNESDLIMTDNLPVPQPLSAPKADKKPRKPAAPKPAKNFSVAELARALKLDPKVARRRMRANVAKAKPMPTPKPATNTARKNSRWEFADTAENRKMITTIIKTAD